MVVTPSSIPGFATRGLDIDLSSERSNDILEDPDDALILKKRISDSNEEESAPEPEFLGMCLLYFSAKFTLFFSFLFFFLRFIYMPISLLTETFEGPRVATGVGMPAPTIPVAPIPVYVLHLLLPYPQYLFLPYLQPQFLLTLVSFLSPLSSSPFFFFFFESFIPWLLILPCVFLNRFTSHCPFLV